jgi:hypothetical protein
MTITPIQKPTIVAAPILAIRPPSPFAIPPA